MRKLLWFAIGFGLSCFMFANYLWDFPIGNILAVMLPVSVTFLLFQKNITFVKKAAAVSLGILTGLAWFAFFRFLYLAPLEPLDKTTLPLSIEVSDYIAESRYGYSVNGTVSIDGKKYKVIAYLNDYSEVIPGDRLQGDFRIRVTTPSAKDSSYNQGNGQFLTASQKSDFQIVHPDKPPIYDLPVVFAHKMKANLSDLFPEDIQAFANAILLGDTTELTYSVDTALKVSGIRHIAAVSGLHVSIVFGIILVLCGFNRTLASIISFPVLLIFAAMTGFTPSVTRAVLMMTVISFGWLSMKEYDNLTGLAFASLMMMLFNPFVVNSVSFQLSVMSVAGILCFAVPLQKKIVKYLSWLRSKRLIQMLGGTLSVSVSAMVFTTPLNVYYFGAIPLFGIATNLLTLWVIGFIFAGVSLCGILGFFWTLGAGVIADFVSVLIRFVLYVARIISQFPFSAVYTQSVYIVIWMILCYVFAIEYWRNGKRHGRILSAVSLSILILSIILSILIPRMDSVRLNVLDVGEGQCILLQSEGHNFMIDCGGDSDTTTANMAAQTLLSQGITNLDGIAFTHYDRDHIGALENLLCRINVDHFYMPALDEPMTDYLSEQSTENVDWIDQLTQIPFGRGILTFSAPGKMKTANENCMCILFESDECDILITGDRGKSGEKHLLKEMQLPDIDILIAGHHGSKNSTSDELLEAVTPEIVVFSVGRNNSYGHPAQEVLERLSAKNCTVYRTDLQGPVLIRR